MDRNLHLLKCFEFMCIKRVAARVQNNETSNFNPDISLIANRQPGPLRAQCPSCNDSSPRRPFQDNMCRHDTWQVDVHYHRCTRASTHLLVPGLRPAALRKSYQA